MAPRTEQPKARDPRSAESRGTAPEPPSTPPRRSATRPSSLTWAWIWVATLVLGAIGLQTFTPEPYRLGFGWMTLAVFFILPLMMFYDFERRSNNRVVLMPGASRLRGAMPGLRQGNPVWPTLLRFLAITLLVIGAARPQLAQGEQKDITQGIDIVLAIDVSGSMLAEDLPPNRMTVAKQVIADFVADQESNRIGLVAFAGKSLTQTPITTDYAIVQQSVETLDPANFGIPGTAIGDAIGNAINKFQDPKAKSKVVILLTDGADNASSLDPREAALFAKQRDIRVYAIGVGTPGGAPIPNPYAQFPGQPKYIMENGQVYKAKLDESVLRDIAKTTGGQYFIATDAGALADAYAEIGRLEKHEVEIHTTKRYRELFVFLAAPALLVLLLETALGATRYRSFV